MMVRPLAYDQAKLLFLCLLRSSSAALATSEPTLSKLFSTHHNHFVGPSPDRAAAASSTALSSSTSTSSSSSSSTSTNASPQAPPSYAPSNSRPLPQLDGHISLRLATRSDVPSIGRVNLATLPENYSATFYNNHMRRWPDLALVAEHFPATTTTTGTSKSATNGTTRKRTTGSSRIPGPYDPNESRDDGKIVGYVLGKVEPHRSTTTPTPLPASTVRSNNTPPPPPPSSPSSYAPTLPTTTLLPRGHVTSLAILSPYRRRGLAALLMNQLHHHMKEGYAAHDVGLHVRVSNSAAKNLYCGEQGYHVQEVIGSYYQDGEDAYFMQKELLNVNETPYDLEREEERRNEEFLEELVEEEGLDGWRKMGGVVKSYWGRMGGIAGGGGGAVGSAGLAAWETGPVELRLPRDIPLVPLEVKAEGKPELLVVESGVVGGGGGDGLEVEEEDGVHRKIMTGSL